MSATESESLFKLIPRAWFEPVVGVWVTLLAFLGVRLTIAGGTQLLFPLGEALWAAVVVTMVIAAFAFGGFGIGLTWAYREYRSSLSGVVLAPLDREEWRWVGRLGAAAVLVMVIGGIWSTLLGHSAAVGGPLITIGSLSYPAGISGLSMGVAGVNDIVNGAPFVLFVALLGGTVMGPAVGALVHGVLQDTLARAGPPAVAIAGTAVGATVLLENSAFGSLTTVHEALDAVVVFGFVLGVAYAYRETENLLVPMIAYGLFNVLAVSLGWMSILASLYASGHLFG